MKKSTQIVILLLILVLFFHSYTKHAEDLRNTNAQNNIVAKQENERIKNLREQKKVLQDKLEIAKQDLVVPNMGTTILLISDTNKECLNDIVSKIDEYNYAGIIAIDNNYSPIDNIEGYLNINDINSLVDKGYEVVLKVSGSDDVAKLYELYSKYFNIMGFYYPSANITKSQVEYYKQINIKNIIIHDTELNDEEIFSIPSIGSYESNARTAFDEANAKSKTMAFTVGYSVDGDKYTDANFSSMLERMNKSKNEGSTDIGNITKSLDRYEEYKEYLNSDEYKQIQSVVDDIQSQIDDIDIQINSKQ